MDAISEGEWLGMLSEPIKPDGWLSIYHKDTVWRVARPTVTFPVADHCHRANGMQVLVYHAADAA